MIVRYIAGCAAILVLTLVGCAGQQLGTPTAPPVPKVAMSGRWLLSEPNQPSCSMKFEGAPGENSGAIHPGGGCPGKFFTSRYWELARGTLTMEDYKQQPLAQLSFDGGRFKGKSIAGMPVTLTR